ncbi:regulator of chromosome condensation family protein, partial [Striga asiatica]
ENAEKKVPDQALMYKEIRKRKEGKTYMSSYEETVPGSLKSELLGRYTKKRKQSLNCGTVHCQDDSFDDDGANNYDKTIHENAERIENEEGEEGGEKEID